MFQLHLSDARGTRIYPKTFTSFVAAVEAAQGFCGLGIRVTIVPVK